MENEDPAGGEVTRLLGKVREGDTRSGEALFQLLYGELHRIAQHHARPGQTLQPTALVNEAWLKINDQLDPVQDRRHFLSLASRAMRQVLANYARDARAAKRGGGEHRVTLNTAPGALEQSYDVVALDDSLHKLSQLNERHARVVELRFLCSLTIAETADVLQVSSATVENDWAMARAWLRTELQAS